MSVDSQSDAGPPSTNRSETLSKESATRSIPSRMGGSMGLTPPNSPGKKSATSNSSCAAPTEDKVIAKASSNINPIRLIIPVLPTRSSEINQLPELSVQQPPLTQSREPVVRVLHSSV